MTRNNHAFYKSPIGVISIGTVNNKIASCDFVSHKMINDKLSPFLGEVIEQFDEYFHGKRFKFNLELHLVGTDFQLKIWNELLKIPYGETISYKGLAKKIGNSNAARAVGNANGKNPISIIIPCHRVIGSNGNLTGYGGGTDRKQWLLDFEKKNK